MVEVSKIKVEGKTIITTDDGKRVEIDSPELLVIKRDRPGAK